LYSFQLFGLFFIFQLIFALTVKSAEIDAPAIYMKGETATIEINNITKDEKVTASFNNKTISFERTETQAVINYKFQEKGILNIEIGNTATNIKINPIPLWFSVIPPLIAILLALVFKEVIVSLLLGIFSGALIIYGYAEGFLSGILKGLMVSIDTYILGAVYDEGHLSIIIFSLLIGGMVNVISKNGGMQGVVNRISKYAVSAKSGQLATWFLGIVIFFDDYANTLIVGNTMRPITDRLKVSREKLAYIVDSTAAPMASIAFVTTWIGAELGYISSGIEKIDGLNEGVYATFINSLAYSFYPILALIFILILILKGKDFGPMHKAESEARKQDFTDKIDPHSKGSVSILEELKPQEGVVPRAYNAIIPVAVVIFGTIAGLLYSGYNEMVWANQELSFWHKVSETIGAADSYRALLWSSFAALCTAIALSLSGKLLSLLSAIDATVSGFKTMFSAIIILSLAWALALVIEDLNTASFITTMLSENISPYLIPAITFLLAALIAFSTGSSWGTMAILYPLILPASWEIAQAAAFDYDLTLSIFHNTVSCVLAGAVLGDHCSPISDTTILSSLSTSCNHIDHIRTQMPYALTVGIVAVTVGTIPSAFGIPTWLSFIVSIATLYGIVHYFGKKIVP